jgi:hypothetical protein
MVFTLVGAFAVHITARAYWVGLGLRRWAADGDEPRFRRHFIRFWI